MGARHRHLHHAEPGPLHALGAQHKLAATALFVVAVASTPRAQVWAFGLHALLLVAVLSIGRVPVTTVLRSVVIELPFVAFACFLPIVGRGPRTDVVGVHLSQPGLWAAWNIVAKGTLGVVATVVLAATTPVPKLLAGMERLRMPRLVVGVMGFTIRYADVLADEARRMRIARASRGHDPRWIWHARAVATSAGTLFVRSYERGERVFLAMQARGYAGAMPPREADAPARSWWCLAVALLAGATAAAAWVSR